MTIRLAADSLVVLAGPSGSGKSTWAQEHFRASQIVSSDRLRGVVGEHEHDLRASADAFAVLDEIVTRRLTRGLLTIVDTLGMERDRIDRWLAIAADTGRPTHLIRFDEEPATVRKRNRSRADAVPAKVLTAQLAKWDEVRDELTAGFDQVHAAGDAVVVSRNLLPGHDGPTPTMRFGLSISAWDWPGGNEDIADRVRGIAAEAEAAGFESIWVMDHFMQIPQVGREWDPMLEAYSTLSFLAATTTRVGIGAMVTCVTHRNLALLGKTIATLDVLSGGRARCGLGVGWFEREHVVHGFEFPDVNDRYLLLADALEFLPLQWGPGTPEFDGRCFSTPQARCYPRPLQEHIPILVGGSGERRTLRLAAQHADACNLFGEPEVVTHKLEVLQNHLDDFGRELADIEVTHLSPILSAPDGAALKSRMDELWPGDGGGRLDRSSAGTVEAHIDRFARLGNAGVDTAIISLADVGFEGSVTAFAPVIDALRA
ncbi:MAG: LLM class flavin-dependent oxidoreductase [Actinomycetota bacterium]